MAGSQCQDGPSLDAATTDGTIAIEVVVRRQGLTPPRIGTPRSKAETLGPLMADVATALGTPFNPWQRHAGDVSMELTRRGGRMRFRASNVGIEVPRQCGKSVFARSRAWTQCLLPNLIEGIGPQYVGWLAQDRAHALRAWEEATDALAQSQYGQYVKRVKLQRGDESVQFYNGSSLRVITPNRTGPRGLSFDLIVLDEALAHPIELLAALAPTQAARDQHPRGLGAQMCVYSSAGDERSTLLNTLGELGRRAVAENDRTRVWLEWSAPPDADPFDPAVWRAAIPTLDRPGGISTAFVKMQSETMDVEDFRREYLCLHTPRPAEQCVDPARWRDAPDDVPGTGLVFAVEVTPSGSWSTIVAVGMSVRGIAVEVIYHGDDTKWLAATLIEKAQRWQAPVVLDGTGPAAWLVPELTRNDVEVVKLGSGEVLSAAQRFTALVEEGRIAHQRDPVLDAAVDAATRRRSGDRWGFDRHAGDVSAVIAASLGAWALDTTQVLQAQVW